MSIPSSIIDASLLDDLGETSLYEDALDDSDEEWKSFHRDTMLHLNKIRERDRQKKPVNILAPSSSAPKMKSERQSSSSEHSSIERLNAETFRSRRSASMTPKRRSHKSGNSSTSGNGGAATPDEWKLVNYAEAASYPILFQLNQQLQSITTQLTDLACSNSIQLRITYKLLKAVVKLDREQKKSVTFWSRLALFLILLAASPVIFRIVHKLYQLRQYQISRRILKYM